MPYLPALLLAAQLHSWTPFWHVRPDDGADTAFGGISLVPSGDGRSLRHPHASTGLPTSLGTRWSLSFEVVYRRLGEQGARVALESRGSKLLWTGADSDYGMMSSFVGEAMVDTRRPEIGRSYRFTLRRDGDVGSVFLDGRLLGAKGLQSNPDTLYVGGDDSSVPSRTTAIEVRNVVLEAADEGSVPAPSTSLVSSNDLALILGADRTVSPPATPYGDRLRLVAKRSRLRLAPGTLVDLAPTNDRRDFRPSEVALVVDGKVVRRERNFGRILPTFSYEVPGHQGRDTKVQVLAADDDRRQVELQRTDVSVAENVAAGATVKSDDETLRIENASKGELYAFLDTEYLGRVENAADFRLDLRRLTPGQRELRFVATADDGALVPPLRSLVEVRPRYHISSDYDHGTLRLEGSLAGTRLRVAVAEGASPAKTRVYLRGALIATSAESSFECDVPMGDVPSGDALIEVVGVGKDGTSYPPEDLTIRVSNPVWDALRARDARARRLDALLGELGKDDANVAYWYGRALAEPAFRTYLRGRAILTADEFGRRATVAIVEAFTVPGRAGEYLGECRAALASRAAHRLELGRLQKIMGLREQARASLLRCLEEAGAGSATGGAARAELSSLQ